MARSIARWGSVAIVVALFAACSGSDEETFVTTTGTGGSGATTGTGGGGGQATGGGGSDGVCQPNPCLHGGTCHDAGATFTCDCLAGYSGDSCEVDIDECAPNPCVNGGQCVDGVASYACQCPAGYGGTNCELNIDDCTPDPCQNGGTCIDGVASYSCDCQPGYTGTNCETAASGCTPNPCLNGGTCNDLGGGNYDCTCLPGYTGNNCAINIDDCTPNPCQNGGGCVDGVNGYGCNCVNGYSGTNCEVAPVPTYCDVTYVVGSGACGAQTEHGRFHNIKTGFGGMNVYYDVGLNCTTPKRGTGNGTAVASPFTPALFPRGYLRLRFPTSGGVPVAGAVSLVEYYLPIEFTVNGLLNTNVTTDVDHSAGLLHHETAGCPGGYTGCLTGVSDSVGPTLERPCTAVAAGTLNGTTLTWGTCGLTPPGPCLGVGCTPTNAQLNWTGASSQIDTSVNPGCVANVSSWGGVWCTSGVCNAVPGTNAPSNDTWDHEFPSLTFSSTAYATAGTTVTLTESVVPDGYADVYSGTEVVTASYAAMECGTLPQLTCDEQ
ncbi:MAG: calcium-binding EGF-like domain-containing protein [Polyangiaceae bacterium]|nr:calcium-binding EGF-like domain-containing protein [Polyangiaceae bacterium]